MTVDIIIGVVVVAVLVGGFALLNKTSGKGSPGSKDPGTPDQ